MRKIWQSNGESVGDAGPDLRVHFSEAQQGEVFEKIAKQFSRVECGRIGRGNFCEKIRFYGGIFIVTFPRAASDGKVMRRL